MDHVGFATQINSEFVDRLVATIEDGTFEVPEETVDDNSDESDDESGDESGDENSDDEESDEENGVALIQEGDDWGECDNAKALISGSLVMAALAFELLQ